MEHLDPFHEIDHPRAGKVVPGHPINYSSGAASVTRRPPVCLGEHTGEVLGSLGYDGSAGGKPAEEGWTSHACLQVGCRAPR